MMLVDPSGGNFKSDLVEVSPVALNEGERDFVLDLRTFARARQVNRVNPALASKLRSRPGEKYYYSNAGYSLLGALVEIVSGQGYEAFLQEQLFKPAGMTRA